VEEDARLRYLAPCTKERALHTAELIDALWALGFPNGSGELPLGLSPAKVLSYKIARLVKAFGVTSVSAHCGPAIFFTNVARA
jgi:hypothetical protein